MLRGCRIATEAGPSVRSSADGFTLIELLTVVAIIAILSGIVIGVGRRASEAGKTARAKVELAVLSAALESYRRVYGDYPRTDDSARLLQALIGKRGPTHVATEGRALLELARFATAEARDPFTDETARLVDPWEHPYRYAYRTLTPWSNSGYVLYSAGPDGVEVPALLAGGFIDLADPANADNIQANQ